MDIRVRPRVRALAPVDTLVATLLDGERVPPRWFSTDDGELAVVGGARRGNGEATVVVVGADPALVIETIGPLDLAREQALALANGLGTGLGAARRRWFRYSPPAGWYGLRRYGVTVWLAPEHPRVPGVVHVFDARPFLAGDAELFEQCLSLAMRPGFQVTDDGTFTPLRSRYGLEGHLRTVHGTRDGHSLVRMAITLGDDRYCYCAHFEGAATLVGTVTALLESVQPLPLVTPKLAELAL